MKNAFDLTGKKIVMTGAAGDIGRATATVLSEQGAVLVLSDLAPTRSHDIPPGAVWHACDVTDRESSEALAAAHPDADALILAAGILPWDDWMAEDWNDSFKHVMDVNALGVVNVARAFLPFMEKAGAGRMVVLGSVAGRIGGVVSGAHYTASKGAANSLVRWLALKAAPSGVIVNGIAPGSVRSRMLEGQTIPAEKLPLGRLAEPEEIAWPIAFLCSDASRYMCGAVMDVNGGMFFS